MGLRVFPCLLMVMFMAFCGGGEVGGAETSGDEDGCRAWVTPPDECDEVPGEGAEIDEGEGERCTVLPDGCLKSFASPCAQRTFARVNDISVRRLSDNLCVEAERSVQSPWIWPDRDLEHCDREGTRCGLLPDGSFYTFPSPCDWENFNVLNDLQVYFINRGSCRFL